MKDMLVLRTEILVLQTILNDSLDQGLPQNRGLKDRMLRDKSCLQSQIQLGSMPTEPL